MDIKHLCLNKSYFLTPGANDVEETNKRDVKRKRDGKAIVQNGKDNLRKEKGIS